MLVREWKLYIYILRELEIGNLINRGVLINAVMIEKKKIANMAKMGKT